MHQTKSRVDLHLQSDDQSQFRAFGRPLKKEEKKCFGYLMSSKNAFAALLRSIAQNGILNIFHIIEDVFKFEHFLIMWDIITAKFKQI